MLKRFSKYVFQSVAGMIGVSVYVLADTFFISVYAGADGLAVLNLILPVYGLIYAIGSMIGIGSATRYGISKAKGERADYYFTQAIAWSVLISIPFVLLGIFIPDKCLALLGADAGLVALGKTYLRIILIGTPFFMSNYSVTAFARNDNATSIAMVGSLAGSVWNIVFDYIFIFPAGLGFSGAALATAFCPIVTMSVCMLHYFGKKCHIGFKWKKMSVRHLISCCQLGVSAFVGEISSAVIAFVFNMLILGLAGSVGVAAYGIVANLSIVGMCIFNGLAQGAQPLISESFGRGESEHVRKYLRWGMNSTITIEIVMIALIWLFTDPLVAIFNSENNVMLLQYAHTGLQLYFLGFLFAGVNIMLVAYFSATANARPAIIGSLMRGAIAIVLCAIVLSRILGMNGVWLSFLASEMLTFVVILILSRKKESVSNDYI